tara:strand:- start:3 stop:581 length:579 start_codon:yes stop_codon:yes gene_type:complete
MTTKRQRTSQKAKRLQDKLKGVPGVLGRRKTGVAVPGGPFDPKKKKDPKPGGPYKPESGPKYSKPMSLKGKPRPALTKSQMLLQAQGKDLKGGQIFTSEKKKKPKGKFNLGGEAATSVGRATVERSQRKARRQKVDEMLNRLYGPSNKPKPKPKPKKPLKKVLGDKIKPRLKKKPIRPSLKKRLADQAKRRK